MLNFGSESLARENLSVVVESDQFDKSHIEKRRKTQSQYSIL